MADEALDGGRIKGGILSARLRWATERIGADWRVRLQRHLNPSIKAVLHGQVLASEWYPLRTLIEIDRAIAALSPGPAEKTYQELGRFSAGLNLGGVYRAFKRRTPHEFFAREALYYRQLIDFGQARYTRTGDTSCLLEVVEAVCYSPVLCASARGYYQRATELHGGKAVRVEERHCHCRGDECCRFEISWS